MLCDCKATGPFGLSERHVALFVGQFRERRQRRFDVFDIRRRNERHDIFQDQTGQRQKEPSFFAHGETTAQKLAGQMVEPVRTYSDWAGPLSSISTTSMITTSYMAPVSLTNLRPSSKTNLAHGSSNAPRC